LDGEDGISWREPSHSNLADDVHVVLWLCWRAATTVLRCLIR
jgi:hypothetical protein